MNSVKRFPSEVFAAEAARVEREQAQAFENLLAASLTALEGDPADEAALLRATRLFGRLGRQGEAARLLQRSLRPGSSARVHHALVETLAECNRTGEAIAAARAASALFPGDVLLQMREALLLPVLYDSTGEIGAYRSRFAEGLSRLSAGLRLDTTEQRRAALAAIGAHTNFYLGYQCRNDRDLQVAWGTLVHRIMAANYPGFSRPLEMPPAPGGVPLRVGYLSARFRDLSATRFFLGWLRGHNPAEFEVYAWHVGAKRDQVTDEVSRIVHRFHHFPECGDSGASGGDPIMRVAQSVRDAGLHALVFLDIGIDPVTAQLAALRLAPVQCMAWDQPITSGLPTVDYALSGALAEPADAADHYSESLVALPGVGVDYRKPAIPWPLLPKTRADFDLPADAVVYLCCQSVFKFLPENDDVFVRIAARVPNARFVFVVTNAEAGDCLIGRLDRAFREAGLSARDHCVLMPQLKHLDYWNLHAVADVFLDTVGWSSGGSIFEAIACRVPVVTLPGEFMRGRQGLAILSALGMTDTVARDRRGYIEFAIRLGTDHSLRQEIVERMARAEGRLFSDPSGTRALEDFFRSLA